MKNIKMPLRFIGDEYCVKRVLLVVLLCASGYISFAQSMCSKIYLPLDNTSGISYYSKAGVSFLIDGFDVGDSNEFYFCSKKTGNIKNTFFTRYEKGNRVYTVPVSALYNGIAYFKDKLYAFDWDKKILSEINPDNGSIINSFRIITKQYDTGFSISNFYFFNSSLVLELFKYTNGVDVYKYPQYYLNGKFVSEQKGKYPVPLAVEQASNQLIIEGAYYVNKYSNYYVFIKLNSDDNGRTVYLFDDAGRYKHFSLDEKCFGRVLYGEEKLTKIKNDKLYIVTREQKKVLITVFNMSNFSGK